MTNPPEDTGSTSRPVRARLEKFADLDAFIAGYSQYFFDGGMLLPTRNPRDAGSRIHLQLEIRGGAVVVRADGMVERIRTAPDGSAVGMVVRFESTDDATAALLRRILSERKQRRTADHPAVVAAPAPAPAPSAPAPVEPQVAAPPVSAAADAGEALDAIASSLDESFDAIFGGAEWATVPREAPAPAPLPPPSVPTPAPALSPVQAPTPTPAPEAAQRPVLSPAAAPDPAPAAPPSAPRPLPVVPRGTMVGMPAFDVAAFLEQKAADEAQAGALQAPAAPAGQPADELDTDSLEDPGFDPRSSQPLGRLALQRVARGPEARPAPTPEPAPSSARSILRGITGEMAAVGAELAPGSPDDSGAEAVARLLAVEPAPVPARDSEDVLDDILGDLSAPAAPRTVASPSVPEAVVGDEPLAPAPPARGLVARFVAWLKSLFGG